jgi:nitrite reductase (NO-forming)
VAPYLAAGFVAQMLLGALSYLVPTVLGGGPARSRASHREFDRLGPLRVAVINAGLAVTLLPVPAGVRTVVGAVILLAFATFLVLLVRAITAWRRGGTVVAPGEPTDVSLPWHWRPPGQRAWLAVAGFGIVALATGVGFVAS